MIGEGACNASGSRLVSFVEMVICNGRKFMLEPEWRPSLKQTSIIP